MGDCFQAIVDRDATAEDAERLATAVLDWLTAEEILQAGPNADCVLEGGDTGYLPGSGWWKAVVGGSDPSFLLLRTNGMGIRTGRTVFHAGQSGLSVLCPRCGASAGVDHWSDAVQEWHERTGPGLLACESCGHAESATEWVYDPPWGFGELGLRFWNWPPLSEAFVAGVARRLGHRTALVAGKL